MKYIKNIEINGHKLTLTAEETNDSASLTVETSNGKYTDNTWRELYEDSETDGLPRMLFESLAPLGEAELYHTFDAWCVYMDDMGDFESERNPEVFASWRRKLDEWHQAAGGLTADETLHFLSDNYNI